MIDTDGLHHRAVGHHEWKPGWLTPALKRNIKREVDASLRLHALMNWFRWPMFMRAFWLEVFDELNYGRPTLYGVLDAVAFSCMGDFLFHGKPMTQSYYDSWYSRVHFPRWLRVRRKA